MDGKGILEGVEDERLFFEELKPPSRCFLVDEEVRPNHVDAYNTEQSVRCWTGSYGIHGEAGHVTRG